MAAKIVISDDAAHLLVVDDDTRIRALLNRYLSENGFRVTVAADGAEARRKLAGLDFDLIIMDVMMPGESGIDVTQDLRIIKNVPIIMLTALAESDSRIEGLEAGADDYLPKPFDPRELVLQHQQHPAPQCRRKGTEDRTGDVRPLHLLADAQAN
jgi:two-component system phosphate regulon response regulator OmpR